jgi:hypothetical protein
MARYTESTPVPGPEAFETAGRDAELSRAAIVLSAGAAVAGRAQRLDRPDALALSARSLSRIARADKLRVADATAPLDIDLRTHLGDRALRLPASTGSALTRSLIDSPDAVTAAALVEASLHSESLLVRTSAAIAALDTTGPRVDVLEQLLEGARSRDPLTRELGRIGVARVAPAHPLLLRLVSQPVPAAPPAGRGAVARLDEAPAPRATAGAPAGVAVLTHGTFGTNTTWWRPGGSLFTYLNALVPPLHLHDPSFQWSGQYSDGARQLAAQQLVDWMAGFGLNTTDFFAHSHGGTVAHLATRRGLTFDRLVLMSWPVHGEWFPDFTRIRRIVDIRVRFDLVILADRGGQTFTPPAAFRGKVVSHVNGWFDHSDTNEPAYWERYDLPEAIQV